MNSDMKKNSCTNSWANITFFKKGYRGKYQYIIDYRSSCVMFYLYMGTYRDMLISSNAISYSKLFNKLCVRTQAFNGRRGILNFIVQGFSFLFGIISS